MPKQQRESRRTRVDEAEATLRSLVAEHRQAGIDRLPPEKTLSEQVGTSHETLRAALARLEQDGEILRRRRVGTVIRDPAERKVAHSNLAFPVNMMLSLSEYLQSVGVEYHVRAAGIRKDPASAEVASGLGLAPDTPVFTASRLYEVKNQPAAFLEHHLPTELYGHKVQIESLTEGVTTFLRDTEKVELTHVQSTLTAEAAAGTVADELQVSHGAPLLVMHARLYADTVTAALGKLVFRPDVLCLAASASEHHGIDVMTAAEAFSGQSPE